MTTQDTGMQREAIARVIREQMREWWDEICSDTGCHPLDIVQEGRRRLSYRDGHWTDAVTRFSADRILALAPPDPHGGEAMREAVFCAAHVFERLRDLTPARANARSIDDYYGSVAAIAGAALDRMTDALAQPHPAREDGDHIAGAGKMDRSADAGKAIPAAW